MSLRQDFVSQLRAQVPGLQPSVTPNKTGEKEKDLVSVSKNKVTADVTKESDAESRKVNGTKASRKSKQAQALKEDRSVSFARVVEKKRTFTIGYRLIPGRTVSNIEYAASVFRQDKDNETYTRKRHVQTARGRLAVRPLYATFDFSREMLDVLLERNVPTDKAERRLWGQSEAGTQWKDLRRSMDKEIAAFLRKQISKHGVRAPERLTRSQQHR